MGTRINYFCERITFFYVTTKLNMIIIMTLFTYGTKVGGFKKPAISYKTHIMLLPF